MLTFKKAGLNDFEVYFNIKCDPQINYWGGFTNAPEKKGLKEWYKKQFDGEQRAILLFFYNEHPCGFFYVDFYKSTNSVELSYGIIGQYRSKGLGTIAMAKAVEYVKQNFFQTQKISAWIIADNLPSKKIAEKNGFEWMGEEKKELFFGEEKTMQLFTFVL